MTNRELDVLVLGFSVGALASLWAGYQLRVRVERWRARREDRARQRSARRRAKSIPFDGSNLPALYAQNAHRVLTGKPRLVPLSKRDPNTGRTRDQHADLQRIPISSRELDPSEVARICATSKQEETARTVREDALAALVGAGYKRAVAEAALDACTPEERAGGLESWVAAALRRAVSKLTTSPQTS